jgi:Asp-tRNA(Asn)/Glu-tRNA(Gln) amidotransferase A subunit family amidase
VNGVSADAPAPPTVVFLEDPLLDDASPEAMRACRSMLESFGGKCAIESRAAPVSMQRLHDLLRSIMLYELAHIYGALSALSPSIVGTKFREAMGDGNAKSDERYRRERAEMDMLRSTFFQAFDESTMFLWPAAPGPAPEGIEWTGDPRYIAPWTVLGGPIVTIPAGTAANGLPLGCLLSGRPGSDALMCRVARDLAA